MPEMTLSEAAKWAGKGRPAILKAIKREGPNRLSARQDEHGQWRIDPAELARVYPPGNTEGVSEGDARSSQDIAEAIAGKDREIALMREVLDELRKQRDDWQVEAAKWQTQAEAQTRLLTYQRQSAAAPEEKRTGWLAGILGRKGGA